MKLLDYIKGRRRGPEAQRIELDAMRDPLLHDAVEGYDKVPGDHSQILERLAGRIAERTAAGTRIGSRKALMERRSRRVRNWSMTAAAAVLVALTTGTLYYLSRDADEDVVAQQTPAKVPAEYDTPLSHRAAEPETADTEAEKAQDEQTARQKNKTIAPEEKVVVFSDFLNVVKDEAVMVEEEYDLADEIEVFERDFVIKDFPPDSSLNRIAAAAAAETNELPAAQAISGRVAGVTVRKRAADSPEPSIAGQVVDASTGDPLPGAVVRSQDAQTLTDADGYFRLASADSVTRAVIADYLGYETGTAHPDTSGKVLIALAPARNNMDEVVVVGYGTQKSQQHTGSVPTSSADTTITSQFRSYLSTQRAERLAEGGPEGSATVEFEVGANGRPRRIKVVEGSSTRAIREARRLLRDGPDWEPSEKKRRITIIL